MEQYFTITIINYPTIGLSGRKKIAEGSSPRDALID